MTTATDDWFSARLRCVLLIQDVGAVRYMDSLYLLRATDFAKAFTRVLDLGRREEKEYRNHDGQLVRWRFKEVLSLDIIAAQLDGAESVL